MSASKKTPVFIVDTREQQPYRFEGFDTIRQKLDTGDYSIQGSESRVSVEKKSHGDAWAMVSGSRERFVRCLERLASLDRALIVIESSLERFALDRPSQIKKVTVATAVGSYVSWMCQYRVPVVWAGSKEYAERVTLRFLYSYWKHRANPADGTLRISKAVCLICSCSCERCVHLNGDESHTKSCLERMVLAL
jgi:ERCC4-type nuclease